MRFLYNRGTEDAWRTAFYRAVEECPWVKVSVVVDANVSIVFCAVFVLCRDGGGQGSSSLNVINTLRTGSFKLFKRPFPGFLTILTL